MKHLILAATAALTLIGGSASAQVGVGAAASATVQPPESTTVSPAEVRGDPGSAGPRQSTTGDPNRRVCRTQGSTGSRLAGEKICKTAREWEEQRSAAKQELDRYQRPPGTRG